ncbi:uncharacterized protein [Palaemon carinicauda]|uniref:uncharacterized protein n=1 Tax=Palaemon carinicauda TaxID=392227 RepID=UPI0035B62607
MLCTLLEDLTCTLHKSVTGMFYNNNNIESLENRNLNNHRTRNINIYMCEPDLLKENNVCTCRKAILLAEDGYIHNSLKEDDDLAPVDFGKGNGKLVLYYSQKNSCIEPQGIAMWPTLSKTQRVHLCNTTIAMEWTIAGLYICRYIQRKLYDRIHSASVSPGRGGVAQDAVEIARDVVDLMRDYDDAMIPEVDELRELLSEPHIRGEYSHWNTQWNTVFAGYK